MFFPYAVNDQTDLKPSGLEAGDQILPGASLRNKSVKIDAVPTITIDDFVKREKIARVDFIKMDIEGYELEALKGAMNTIKAHKPKLAISLYHKFDDFTLIPLWISQLGCGYELYLDHYTIYAEETVLFARMRSGSNNHPSSAFVI